MSYQNFLDSKRVLAAHEGLRKVPPLNPQLFPFQSAIVKWALQLGRACIFADCGLGKTPMELEWARVIVKATDRPVLLLAPLAVTHQHLQEAKKFRVKAKVIREHADIDTKGINITNYELLHKFDTDIFAGVVLDESSILKNFTGTIRTAIIEQFRNTQFKLAATATPAPNDHMELGNHAEFVGVMTRSEMLSMFFVHDGAETSKWRLKGHAQDKFWQWVSSWAVCAQKPSDLGEYSDERFVLPDLKLHQHVVESATPEGKLFAVDVSTLQERRTARRASIADRVKTCIDLVDKSEESWVVWCDLNAEADCLEKCIKDAVQISGSDTPEQKEKVLNDFSEGRLRVLVTKTSIAGFGLNWQHCRNMAFVGLSDSYEQFYQGIRRCWRFGQTREVHAHIITSRAEQTVVRNIERKHGQMTELTEGMLVPMRTYQALEAPKRVAAVARESIETVGISGWTAKLGDCVDRIMELDTDSIHYSIFSPPFASLYTYSNSERDMGNCRSDAEFATHFRYLVPNLFRALKPGRLVSFHCMNLPAMKERDGWIGLKDFRGELIRMFIEQGFIYHSEVVIWKDPVIAMQRTKALGLLHKQLKKDSCMSRQGIPDYLVTMRKPGPNDEPVTHTDESFPVKIWQRYASPIWMDINPSDTLQYQSARENDDERHICPLQLEVIRRAMELWTNPNDVVLSPFMGIGSEGYVAVEMGRRFIGIELKESYYRQAVVNLEVAEQKRIDTAALFASAENE